MTSMRTILACLLAAGLLAGGVGFATANPGNATNTTAQGGDAPGEGEDNATTTDARAAYVAELKAARRAALDSFKEDRKAAIAAFNASMLAIRESYLENKTLVIEACRAAEAKPDDFPNATKDEKLAFAHCVRDGLKPLKEQARADMEEARETFREAMKASRTAAIAGFAKARAEAAKSHRPEGAGRP